MRGTPVLATTGGDRTAELMRVSYATRSKAGAFFMPAYPPFLSLILNDLNAVFGKEIEFTDNALMMIERGKEMEKMYLDKHLDPSFKFKTKPYHHQLETMRYLVYNPRSIASLDPGLGKSKVACDGIAYLKKKALIIVPAFLVDNWVSELATHYPGNPKVNAIFGNSEKTRNGNLGIERKYKQIDVLDEEGKPKLTKAGKPRKKRVLVSEKFSPIDADILICGYEIASINKEQIYKNFPYEILVLDESHKCKGYKSQRTIAISELSQKCHYRWALSGSVSLGDPRDLFSQLNILTPQILGQDYWEFCRQHLVVSKWNKHVVEGYKNLDRMNKIMRRHSIRYKIDDCLDLPSRSILKRYVDLTDEQIQLEEDLKSKDDLFIDGGNVPKEHAIVALGKLSQVTGGFMYLSTKDPDICNDCHNVLGCIEAKPPIKPYTKHCSVVKKAPPKVIKRLKKSPKMDMMDSLLDEILADDTNKIIIWARYTEEVDQIENMLKEKGFGYERITDNPKASAEVLNSDPEKRVLLGNIAMGVGFTANVANYMIYYSITYSLEDWEQSIARNRRIGQDKKQIVYVILCRYSIDERSLEALEMKKDVVEALLSNLNCFTCKHNRECIMRGIKQYDPDCVLDKKVSLRR